MEKDSRKNLANSFLALLIFYFIVIIFVIVNKKTIDISVVIAILYMVGFLLGYIYTKQNKKIGGIIGLIMGVLMMLTIISDGFLISILGLFIFIYSIKYLKDFN